MNGGLEAKIQEGGECFTRMDFYSFHFLSTLFSVSYIFASLHNMLVFFIMPRWRSGAVPCYCPLLAYTRRWCAARGHAVAPHPRWVEEDRRHLSATSCPCLPSLEIPAWSSITRRRFCPREQPHPQKNLSAPLGHQVVPSPSPGRLCLPSSIGIEKAKSRIFANARRRRLDLLDQACA